MYKRLIAIASLTALLAAISAVPAAAERSCGTLPGGPAPRTVTIFHGPVSCAQARAAAKDYSTGRSTFHGPVNGPRSDQYITLPGGWRCSVIEQGGASCSRGGSPRNPRDLIGFVLD
jgi:hypothetical protein